MAVGHTWRFAAGISLVALLAACSSPARKTVATSSTTGSPATTTTTTATTGTVKPTTTPAPSGLRAVDWGDISVPGSLCFRTGLIQLHNGEAQIVDSARGTPNIPPGTGPSYVDVQDNYAPVRYFDLEPGVPAAFVPVDCNNNGGTADGIFLYALVVYGGSPGHLDLVGTITPRVQPPDVLPTLLGVKSVTPGRLSIRETWYQPSDGTCCPSGNATSAWGFSHGTIYPISTSGGPTG